MTDDRRERAWALFDRLADVPTEERETVLRAACEDDLALRSEVDRLLAIDDRLALLEDQGGFFRSPLVREPGWAGPASEPAPPPPGRLGFPDLVGRYRVGRLLGEGGMGAVYEAEQGSPHRTVALKVVRPGLLSQALLKRFAQEVEILGRLRHPGIAQIYEAGVAEDGQPFFAMEFILGLPLDEYANRYGLNLSDRVDLLARVCDAVQHAHDRGVIHRDLKPANILVDETGQAKVLDFGVARATGADLLTGADLTRTGQLLGTPSYMSPEQVAADPAAVDHRSDVFTLGVILFELLAHRLPSPLENRPLAEAARLILEQDAPRLGSINPELRGDLETIVAKALEKDPARRYQSAADLAADLRRWLAHEPILARPPSALYQLRKFARRHTALVGGVTATVVALVLGLVGTILFAVAEARQRGQAEHYARETLFQAYRARLAAATAALSAHDVTDAASQLNAVPENLRDWEWRHLQGRLDDSAAVIPFTNQGVGFLLGSSDRLRAATVAADGLRVTDLESGEGKTLPIPAGPERLLTIAQTRRGLRVVAWNGNTTFELLDETGRVLSRVAPPHQKSAAPVTMSPDGARLACPWNEGQWFRIAILDATSGKQTAVCDGHRNGVWVYTFSPDGTRLASGGEDNLARVWDATTGTLLATCRGHASKVVGVAFSPDGTQLATTSSDGTVRQWNSATGRETEAPYDRHSGEVVSAAFSPDGQSIASAGTDRTVRVWRALGRQDVAVLHGHTGGVVEVAFAASGRRLASLSRQSFMVPAGDGTARVWEVDPQAPLPSLTGHTSYVYPVAYCPDGRWIASGGWDNTLRLWDAATGEPCATLPHPGVVWSLAFEPSGRWLVSATNADDRLRFWDVASARVCKEIQAPPGNFRSLTISPDGRRIAATPFDQQSNKHYLHVIDITSGERLYSAEGWALAYSPDGRWLAVRAADEKTVLLLDAQTHETIAQFQGHKKLIYKAVFSSDSRLLASCSQDRTVRLWQIDGGECQVLRGHTDEVFAAAFHPDGRRLATTGRDRAIWLWDLARSEEVARLPGHTSYVWSLAFSPDGQSLASGSGDFMVRLWDTAPLKSRYQARRDAAALRPKAEQLLEPWWRQNKEPAEILEILRADHGLSGPLRHAAELAVLRHAMPPKSGK